MAGYQPLVQPWGFSTWLGRQCWLVRRTKEHRYSSPPQPQACLLHTASLGLFRSSWTSHLGSWLVRSQGSTWHLGHRMPQEPSQVTALSPPLKLSPKSQFMLSYATCRVTYANVRSGPQIHGLNGNHLAIPHWIHRPCKKCTKISFLVYILHMVAEIT